MKYSTPHRTNTGLTPCIHPLAMAVIMLRLEQRRLNPEPMTLASKILGFFRRMGAEVVK